MNRDLPLLRLNPAEAIFAPFHDPNFHEELDMNLELKTAIGGRMVRHWDRLGVEWDNAKPGSDALTMKLAGRVRRAHYKHFIFCIVLPAGVEARFSIKANNARVWLGSWNSGQNRRVEIQHPVPDGKLADVELTIRQIEAGPGIADLYWFGLGNSSRLDKVIHYDLPYGDTWDGLLNLPTEWPEQTPFRRGLLFSEEDLGTLRRKLHGFGWNNLFTTMEQRARVDLFTSPEKWLGAHVPWTDTRYLRARQGGGSATFNEALIIGFVGLILKDLTLARQALRHLLTLVHTGDWAVADDNRLQGSTWDQRCFHEEMIATAVSLLTDWYAWALSPRAHELIAQALWDKGLAVIERDMMKFEHLYTINQGPWFCRARILGGLMLETSWPRMGEYVGRAKKDMLEGLDNYLLEDGGTDEGFGYFAGTMETTLGGLLAYARARKMSVADVLPPKLTRSEHFVAAVSAMEPGRMLLDGDNSNDEAITDAIPMLTGLFPDQIYKAIALASLPMPSDPNTYYRQYYGTGVYACIFGPEKLEESRCIVPEFAQLPQTGQMTSNRASSGHSVRIHFAGAKAHASHTHFDKGNFTLELDGHPFLIDRGVVRYDDPRSVLIKKSSRHNVITPIVESGTFANQASVTEATIPQGSGDASSFSATIDLCNVWREQFLRAGRKIYSDHPLEFRVVDFGVGEIARPIAFHLQSLHPFEITKQGAQLVIDGIKLEIDADWASAITQAEDSVDCHLRPVHHLIFSSEPIKRFRLQTLFKIEFQKSPA